MEEIILELQDVHDMPNWMVNIDGVYSYLNRKPSLNIEFLNAVFELSTSKELTKYLIYSAGKEYIDLTAYVDSERYIERMPSVYVDRYNSLELIGAMRYHKQYTLIYDLSQYLDFCLAGAFNSDVKLIKDKLLEKCEKLNMSYDKLSQAIMLGDINLLRGMNMQVFLNLSDDLNDYIEALMLNPQAFKYAVGNRVVSLADTRHTPESRIAIFIMHKVLFFAQLLLNMIINLFKHNKVPFVSDSSCMLLSKGLYNIVFTSKTDEYPLLHFKYKGNELRLNASQVIF